MLVLRRAELIHQLNVSGAKCIFTDSQRYSIALQAAESVGLPSQAVYVTDCQELVAEEGSLQSIESLLAFGSYQWQKIDDIDVLSNKYVGKRRLYFFFKG